MFTQQVQYSQSYISTWELSCNGKVCVWPIRDIYSYTIHPVTSWTSDTPMLYSCHIKIIGIMSFQPVNCMHVNIRLIIMTQRWRTQKNQTNLNASHQPRPSNPDWADADDPPSTRGTVLTGSSVSLRFLRCSWSSSQFMWWKRQIKRLTDYWSDHCDGSSASSYSHKWTYWGY